MVLPPRPRPTAEPFNEPRLPVQEREHASPGVGADRLLTVLMGVEEAVRGPGVGDDLVGDAGGAEGVAERGSGLAG